MTFPYPQVEWHANGDGPYWLLSDPYLITFPLTWKTSIETLPIPEGFRFDLASIPRPLRWFIEPYELSIAAPLIHDWLYQHGGVTPEGTVTRAEADLLLRLIAAAQGVSWLRRWVAWGAVRLFGWAAWRTSQP